MTTETTSTTIAYHGSSLTKVRGLLDAIAAGSLGTRSDNWLYVTETPELAARYANAQATRVVDPRATTPGEHTAIVKLAVHDFTRWLRRPAGHASLDAAETSTRDVTVLDVRVQPCSYRNCGTCQNWHAYAASHTIPQE